MKLLFIADPLESFKIIKDSTYAMMREAQRRGHSIMACEPKDVRWLRGEKVTAFVRDIRHAGACLTIIQTATGSAQGVALAIDRAAWPEVAGTLSGDDTVFIATDGAAAQRRLGARLREVFPA